MRTIDTKEFANILNQAEAIRFDYNALIYPCVDIEETDEGDEYYTFSFNYEENGDSYEYYWYNEDFKQIVITDDGYIEVYVGEEKFRIDILNITKLK